MNAHKEAPLRVGLTGGLASGKSTVAHRITEAGCLVLDADRLVADLYRPGEPGALAVRELFGPSSLDSTGAVDHRAVAARVFADEEARHALERAIHPLVRRRFEEITGGQLPGAIVALEATLLVEAGFGPGFDLVATVEAPAALRLARAIARGLPEEGARARLAAQGDGTPRRQGSHRILDNDRDLDRLERQIAAFLDDLRALAQRSATAGHGS
ncbi:MAG TPA: dephospho-CoA kinase [Thermoanaerobaculia bacterium]|nr:dephospho-CoA kinase [Thermoanaerobaculia bacterium]